MPNSIWDTRFTRAKPPMALDAAVVDALFALDDWITIHGAHVEIDGDGNVLHGAGGKFNNSNYYRHMNDKQYQNERVAKWAAERKAQYERLDEPDVSTGFPWTTEETRNRLYRELEDAKKRGASKDEINTIKEMIDKTEKDLAKHESVFEIKNNARYAAEHGFYDIASLREGFAKKAEQQENAAVERELNKAGYSKEKIDRHERERNDRNKDYIKNQKSIFGGSGWW